MNWLICFIILKSYVSFVWGTDQNISHYLLQIVGFPNAGLIQALCYLELSFK